ncbi:MAG: hypothetical protein A2Y12_17390 [Planctomycetes bacterium GWF2_42_9]|nr:MAG: hypothetical protein A2Y12_17390 [Planctomycetes bacterium GWF2_42_9]HAL44644.1 hypothetical protein [Phycisphaerales bacterium]
MTFSEFCKLVGRQNDLSNAQRAVAILWFLNLDSAGIQKNAKELATIIKENNIGSPNVNELAKRIRSTRCVYVKNKFFSIREDAKAKIREWFNDGLNGIAEEIPINQQFLSEEVWKKTRGYIEKICIQLNGAYLNGYYDCTAVMIRRLIETLIIECYEKLKREQEIKNTDGYYKMLADLVLAATANNGLTLGRDATKKLSEIKILGDRSAHNRRYNAKKTDLDSIKDGLRLCTEELLHIADFYRT